MKILFIGTTGVHHALVASHLFLDKLDKPDFALLEGFGDNALDASGRPILVNDDVEGNQVYTLGVGKEVNIAGKAIEQMIELLGYSSRDLLIKPILIKGEKLLLMLSKIPAALGGRLINKYISKIILKKEFPHIVKDMAEFKKQLSKTL